jgi:hypothetical protein
MLAMSDGRISHGSAISDLRRDGDRCPRSDPRRGFDRGAAAAVTKNESESLISENEIGEEKGSAGVRENKSES